MSGRPGPRTATDERSQTVVVDGLHQRVLDFLGGLRRAGINATQSEAIDAVRAMGHIELLERVQLREGLAAVTVTSPTRRRVFDELFDLYFPPHVSVAPVPVGTDAADPDTGHPDVPNTDDREILDELTDRLGRGGDERIRQVARHAVDTVGRVEGRDGSVSYYEYRVHRVVDAQRLLHELLSRAQDGGEHELTALEAQLLRDEFDARLRTFRDEVAAEVRRRAVDQRGVEQVARRLTRPPVEELDLVHLTADEQAELDAHVRPLARKLAARVAVKRRHGREGRLDVRRTVRRSLSTGGVPFDPAFRPRRTHKPELFVICDVSGSVASFARFTLALVHALQEQFTKVRSFAFVDTLDEVTSSFEGRDGREAMAHMVSEADLVWSDGHSDYGRSLERFAREYTDDLTPRSTVLVLGDARNNYRQANAWVLDEVRRRARHVYWLNPEPIQFWDTGDSIASTYGRHVDEMVEVRNLAQLARFVERIA